MQYVFIYFTIFILFYRNIILIFYYMSGFITSKGRDTKIKGKYT